MPPRIAIILNDGSGPVSPKYDQLKVALGQAAPDATLITARDPAHIPGIARGLADQGFEVVAAAGGDGTVNAVASGLIGTPAALGVVPMGTFNHLAKDLGIPLETTRAVQTLVEGVPTPIDLGEVNGRLFLNNLSIGAYPAFVQARGNVRGKPRVIRWVLYFAGLIRVLAHLPRLFVRVEVDGRRISRITPLVFVGNNEYRLEEPGAGTRPSVTGARLSLIMTRRRGPWGLLRLAARAAVGNLRGVRDLDELVGRNIHIETAKSTLHAGIDGEVVTLRTPIRCISRPGAIRVMVPAPAVTKAA